MNAKVLFAIAQLDLDFCGVFAEMIFLMLFSSHLVFTVNSQIEPALEYNPLSNITHIEIQFFFSKTR